MPEKIVIIDPNPAFGQILKNASANHFVVRPFSDCNKAMQDRELPSIKAFVLSIDHANEINFKFLMHLRSSTYYYKKHVFVITSNDQIEFSHFLIQMGATSVFTKPFDPLSYVEHIRSCIDVDVGAAQLLYQ